MRGLLIYLLLMVVGGTGLVQAQSTSKLSRIEQISEAVADAYASRNLGALDRFGLLRGSIKIIVYNSLEEGNGQTVRTFSTFYRAERWLSNYGPSPNLPARGVGELTGCRQGDCEYEYPNGILHNHLYLSTITYGFRNGRYYIKAIILSDGD